MDVMSWHVGRGADWRGLTVFPVWRPAEGARVCSTDSGWLSVSELDDGPSVGSLEVTTTGTVPVLVLEGQLFEGGWQHRMALHTTLLAAGESREIDVACVEAGRWVGDRQQRTAGRRATPYVRSAAVADDDHLLERGLQGEVWDRVESQLTRLGAANESMSLVAGLAAATPPVDASASVDDEPPPLLPGQTGVVIGVGGQPYLAEVFESPEALAAAYDGLLASAGPDAALLPVEPTPARRVQRFLRRAEQVGLDERREAGTALEASGRGRDVDLRATLWRDRTLHGRVTNLRHPILVEA